MLQIILYLIKVSNVRNYDLLLIKITQLQKSN